MDEKIRTTKTTEIIVRIIKITGVSPVPKNIPKNTTMHITAKEIIEAIFKAKLCVSFNSVKLYSACCLLKAILFLLYLA